MNTIIGVSIKPNSVYKLETVFFLIFMANDDNLAENYNSLTGTNY